MDMRDTAAGSLTPNTDAAYCKCTVEAYHLHMGCLIHRCIFLHNGIMHTVHKLELHVCGVHTHTEQGWRYGVLT